MTWLMEFYHERRGILARYSVEAPSVIAEQDGQSAVYPRARLSATRAPGRA